MQESIWQLLLALSTYRIIIEIALKFKIYLGTLLLFLPELIFLNASIHYAFRYNRL